MIDLLKSEDHHLPKIRVEERVHAFKGAHNSTAVNLKTIDP